MLSDHFGPCDYQAIAVRLRLMFGGSILSDEFRGDLNAFLNAPCAEAASALMRHDDRIVRLFVNTPEARQHRRTERQSLRAKRQAERSEARTVKPSGPTPDAPSDSNGPAVS